jgi:hypothetical protein
MSPVIALLVSVFVAAPGNVRSEEPKVRSIQIKLRDRQREATPTEFVLPDLPLDSDLKVLIHDFNIDDNVAAFDVSRRTYTIICSDRHAQLLKESKTLVVADFHLNTKDEKDESIDARSSLVNRFGMTLRRATALRAPASSKKIADSVIEALCQARERDQIRGFNIDLEIEKGQVTIRGDVPSQPQRMLVERIVRGVPEVLHVENCLEVKESK